MALIGKILNDYRYANRMGMRELAQQLGVSAATVSRIESGKPMEQATIVKLFNMLFAEERPIEFRRKRKEQDK